MGSSETPAAAPHEQSSRLSPGRWVLAALMVGVGVLHFTHAQTFASIVPRYLPAPLWLVWISGACEIGLGLALLHDASRRWAAYGLVALYIAVFPANVNMALHPDLPVAGVPSDAVPSALALWLRLPLQLVLIAWALRYVKHR